MKVSSVVRRRKYKMKTKHVKNTDIIKNSTRIEWVDTAKFICIGFVMVSHYNWCPSFLNVFFSPFFLAGFFFLSGFSYKKGKRLGDFFLNKFKTLLIPWMFFSVYDITSSHIITFHEHSSLSTEFIRALLQIRAYGDSIWFIACLFISFIPFYFFIERMKPRTYIILSTILSIISILYCQYMPKDIFPWNSAALPWHLETIFVADFLMIVGYHIKPLFNLEWKHRYDFFKLLIPVLYTLMILFNSIVLKGPDMRVNNYGDNWIFMLLWYPITFLGIGVLIVFSSLIHSNKFIQFIGQNTLIYFGLHYKFFSFVEAIFVNYGLAPYLDISVLLQLLSSVLLTALISLILIIPTIIILRYFPFVIGKWYEKIPDN